MRFVGRRAEIARLRDELDMVGNGGLEPGRCLLLRGRRRVGKSRLVEEFCRRSGVEYVFYSAAGVPTTQELDQFQHAVRDSNLRGRDLFDGVSPHTWDAALRLLAQALPDDAPSVVVLDEVPYLAGRDDGFEGTLQRVWDRVLSRKPVLLILIGSDLSMMEALDTYGRPFYQRGRAMLLNPLSPADVGAMLDLKPADAFDAYLVTGGLPLICAEWASGTSVGRFLEKALNDPTSALVVSAERVLAAEFPTEARARLVLSAVGSGERTYTAIRGAAGDMSQATLSRAVELLGAKRVVVGERPLSTRASHETRYRVTDPYLRFWLYFVGPHLTEVDRGRGDRLLARIDAGWSSWRGRAVEPVVREALSRILPTPDMPWLDSALTAAVGGYWTRNNAVEVDLVGADREPVAKRIGFVGSVKWRNRAGFGANDVAEIHRLRTRVPGATDDTPVLAVCRDAGDKDASPRAVTAILDAADLVAAWG